MIIEAVRFGDRLAGDLAVRDVVERSWAGLGVAKLTPLESVRASHVWSWIDEQVEHFLRGQPRARIRDPLTAP